MTQLTPFSTPNQAGVTLRGSLHLPDAPAPASGYPVVVLFHGFNGQRMEGGQMFVKLARALAASGYAVLAWDRAGHGESDGEFFDTSVQRDVSDTLFVLESLRGSSDPVMKQLNLNDLHLVGYSLGGVIASTTAAELSVPGAEGDRVGTPKSVTLWCPAASFVEGVENNTVLGQPVSLLKTQGYIDAFGQRIGSAINDDAVGFDPFHVASAYPGPMLLLHGDADPVVPVASSKGYVSALGSRAKLDVVKGADHGWAQVPQREHAIASTVAHVKANS